MIPARRFTLSGGAASPRTLFHQNFATSKTGASVASARLPRVRSLASPGPVGVNSQAFDSNMGNSMKNDRCFPSGPVRKMLASITVRFDPDRTMLSVAVAAERSSRRYSSPAPVMSDAGKVPGNVSAPFASSIGFSVGVSTRPFMAR